MKPDRWKIKKIVKTEDGIEIFFTRFYIYLVWIKSFIAVIFNKKTWHKR